MGVWTGLPATAAVGVLQWGAVAARVYRQGDYSDNIK